MPHTTTEQSVVHREPKKDNVRLDLSEDVCGPPFGAPKSLRRRGARKPEVTADS